MKTKEKRTGGFLGLGGKKTAPHRLTGLKDLKRFEVAKDSIDVRGWEVFGENGIKLGKVEELIVDTASLKVRYLDIDINDALVSKHDQGSHLLIPIGIARIDESRDDIWVETMDVMALFRSPIYRGGPITREMENAIRKSLRPQWNYNREMADNDYYNGDDYDENRFYDRRGPSRQRLEK